MFSLRQGLFITIMHLDNTLPFFKNKQRHGWRVICLRKELAGFRQKTRSQKWQGGHLLGAFRGSGFRLHCRGSTGQGPISPNGNGNGLQATLPPLQSLPCLQIAKGVFDRKKIYTNLKTYCKIKKTMPSIWGAQEKRKWKNFGDCFLFAFYCLDLLPAQMQAKTRHFL